MISRHFLRCALPVLLGVAVAAVTAPATRAEDTVLAMPGQNVLFLSRYIADDQHLWSKQGLNVKILDIIGIGSMSSTGTPKQAASRIIVPAFCGISGWKSAICIVVTALPVSP